MARHDAKRGALATGKSNITVPTAYWRQYLGGAVTGSQMLTASVAGNTTQDLLFATNGQVVAKDVTDAVLWQTPIRGITSFAGIGDVNGDGVLDVVAESKDQVIIVSVSTGAIEWSEPAGEMGTIGTVRVGDLTGDGKPDVLVTECGCCGVNSGNTGFIWTFGSGFASASHAGTIPASTFGCGSYYSTTLVQADGSGPYEILIGNGTQFSLVNGEGVLLAQIDTSASWTSLSECTTGNIDGMPGDEMVCLLSTNIVSTPRQIFVLHYDYSASPPTLTALWSPVVAPADGGDMRWVDPLEDLDGDGLFELAVSTNDPTNGWETHIYDALTGTDLVTPIPGQIIAGTATLSSMTSRVLLTSSNTNVTAWAFTRSPSPSLVAQWMEPNVAVLTAPVAAQGALQAIDGEVLATDLNGDGLADAVMQNLASTSTAGVVAFSGAGGHATQIASWNLPTATDPLTTWLVPPITLPTAQVALARSDGILNLLDDHLQPSSTGSPATEVDVKVGGYYASGAFRELYDAPRLVALGSGPAQSVIVTDSRTALLRFDAAAASLAVSPTLAWQVTHTYAPTVVSGLSGNGPAMACLALTEPVTNPPVFRARVVNVDGTIGWDTPLSGAPLNDLAPGNFNGDSVPDFALQLGSTSNADLTTLALSGADGSLLWTTPPMNPGGGGTDSAGVSIGQWGAGPPDDVYFQGGGTFVLSGADGSQLAAGGPAENYHLPILSDTTGSGQDEVLLTASEFPVSLYSHDLQTVLWRSSDNDQPYPYGALAQCPGTPPTQVLTEGSWGNPARLKFTTVSGTGASLGAFTTIVLAGGKLYPNETAARTAGAFLGQLTAANAHSNLTGQNRPSVVVGSSDGWMYGVNPCNGTLDFAVSVGAEVGEAVFGDTDGDGLDEILVTAADGYMYDYKGFSIAAPAYVWDTDPDHGITNHEVSNIVTTNKLSATWASVAGATSYSVQVVTAVGQKMVSTPPWQNVGNVTSTSLPGLPLTDDTKYIFAVRAIGPNGPSIDALSPGVTVHFPDAGTDGGPEAGMGAGDAGEDGGRDAGGDAGKTSMDGGLDGGSEGLVAGGGCSCRAGGAPRTGGTLATSLLVSFAFMRRRRRSKQRVS